MITYSEVKEYKRLPFEQYTSLKGFSHSFLKSEVGGQKPEFIVNEKMKIGSMVDTILTEPENVDVFSPYYEIGRKYAIAIKERFGELIKHFEAQVSYTAKMEHNGFVMPVCGRLDWLLRGHADIDLKVTGAKTNEAFRALLYKMGYNNQQWNYARMAGVPKAYILPYSTTAGRCLDLVEIPVTEGNAFWESKILMFGSYAGT